MTKSILFALMLTVCGTAWAFYPRVKGYYPVVGLWLTENHRAVIQTEDCGNRDGKLCGKIYWIIKGGMQTDSKNPDEALRSRPMCGLQVLWGFQQDMDDTTNLVGTHWIGGRIYKADDGDTYHAEINVLSHDPRDELKAGPPDQLEVRGYIGIPLLGASQTWTRVSAADYPPCAKSAAH